MKRVGTGTSVRSAISIAFCRRMKATSGSDRHSTSPIRMFDASAPGGIFFRKCSLYYRYTMRQCLLSIMLARKVIKSVMSVPLTFELPDL